MQRVKCEECDAVFLTARLWYARCCQCGELVNVDRAKHGPQVLEGFTHPELLEIQSALSEYVMRYDGDNVLAEQALAKVDDRLTRHAQGKY